MYYILEFKVGDALKHDVDYKKYINKKNTQCIESVLNKFWKCITFVKQNISPSTPHINQALQNNEKCSILKIIFHILLVSLVYQ